MCWCWFYLDLSATMNTKLKVKAELYQQTHWISIVLDIKKIYNHLLYDLTGNTNIQKMIISGENMYGISLSIVYVMMLHRSKWDGEHQIESRALPTNPLDFNCFGYKNIYLVIRLPYDLAGNTTNIQKLITCVRICMVYLYQLLV